MTLPLLNSFYMCQRENEAKWCHENTSSQWTQTQHWHWIMHQFMCDIFKCRIQIDKINNNNINFPYCSCRHEAFSCSQALVNSSSNSSTKFVLSSNTSSMFFWVLQVPNFGLLVQFHKNWFINIINLQLALKQICKYTCKWKDKFYLNLKPNNTQNLPHQPPQYRKCGLMFTPQLQRPTNVLDVNLKLFK